MDREAIQAKQVHDVKKGEQPELKTVSADSEK
jgi:hypothetical protein